jgi:hypothetical protein
MRRLIHAAVALALTATPVLGVLAAVQPDGAMADNGVISGNGSGRIHGDDGGVISADGVTLADNGVISTNSGVVSSNT